MTPPRRLGGWLKMGMVGTTPAAGRVLLVGDAAGLVNPLQGEGISQAMTSGHAAAAWAILGEPGSAATHYLAALAAATCRTTGSLPPRSHGWSVTRGLFQQWRVSAMTAGRFDAVAGGWSVFWNELLDGAPPNRHQRVAAALNGTGELVTRRSSTAKWFDSSLAKNEPLSSTTRKPSLRT